MVFICCANAQQVHPNASDQGDNPFFLNMNLLSSPTLLIALLLPKDLYIINTHVHIGLLIMRHYSRAVLYVACVQGSPEACIFGVDTPIYYIYWHLNEVFSRRLIGHQSLPVVFRSSLGLSRYGRHHTESN